MSYFRHYSIDRVYDYIDTIATQSGAISPEAQALLASKRLKLQEDAIYVRYAGAFAGGNIVELLPNSQAFSRGTTNLYDRKLAANTYFFIDSVYIGHASTTDPDGVSTYTNLVTNVPSAVANGHLLVKQNGGNVINLIISQFLVNAASNQPKRAQATPLTDVRHLDPQREINFTVECAENSIAAAGTDAFEVILYGHSTQQKLW